jgi:hypothetical protein
VAASTVKKTTDLISLGREGCKDIVMSSHPREGTLVSI